jgi:hypothetical protein
MKVSVCSWFAALMFVHSAYGQYAPFLKLPIGAQCKGVACDQTTAKVSAVVDHSGSLYCARSGLCDNINLAFDETRRDTSDGLICDILDKGTSVARGYARNDLQPISLLGMNYVSAPGESCSTSFRAYLNYDGHSGTDFPYQIDTIVKAPADGVLDLPSKSQLAITGGPEYNAVRITHENGLSTLYLHMQVGSIPCTKDVANPCVRGGVGVPVKRGDEIGRVGKVGASGPHLHFEVFKSSNLRNYNPYNTVGALLDPYCANQSVSQHCAGYLWETESQVKSKLADTFDGNSLSPSVWVDAGYIPNRIAVGDGVVHFGIGGAASTKDRVAFAGDRIDFVVVAAGPGSGRDTWFRLVDSTTGDFIRIGDTSYQNQGLYFVASGAFNYYQASLESGSGSGFLTYVVSIDGAIVTISRGASVDLQGPKHVVHLPNAISGHTFYFSIGTGCCDGAYSPGEFDSIQIKTSSR